MSFPRFAVPPEGEFLRDALGNPLPDESLLVLKHIDRLERENAALKGALAKADVLAKYAFNEEGRDLRVIECWVYPEDVIVRMDRAAFDAARKEAQPCQCTNGVIRSVGRDNDEVIEDCPDCSGSKEVQP